MARSRRQRRRQRSRNAHKNQYGGLGESAPSTLQGNEYPNAYSDSLSIAPAVSESGAGPAPDSSTEPDNAAPVKGGSRKRRRQSKRQRKNGRKSRRQRGGTCHLEPSEYPVDSFNLKGITGGPLEPYAFAGGKKRRRKSTRKRRRSRKSRKH